MGNFHRIGKARLQTMFNDGGWGSGTSEDMAIEERMRIAVEGIIVCDYEISNDGNNLIAAKARVTSRGMWTDDGRLLESVRSSAIAASADMPVGTKLSTVERAVSSAIRFAVKNYCNKRPDVIVVAHRAGESSRPIPKLDAVEDDDDDDEGRRKSDTPSARCPRPTSDRFEAITKDRDHREANATNVATRSISERAVASERHFDCAEQTAKILVRRL